MRTELYRHYNADGELLYVGMSVSSVARLSEHRRDSIWFDKITTVTIERYSSREECAVAELKAIQNEKPKFNTMRNRIQPVKPSNNERMTGQAVAAALGIDRKTLRKWVRRGVCPVAPLPGIEPPVWHRAEIESFVGRAL